MGRRLGIPESPWASPGIPGHPWASLGIPGHPWASLGIPGHLWASLGISGHLWASLGIPGHPCAWLLQLLSLCLAAPGFAVVRLSACFTNTCSTREPRERARTQSGVNTDLACCSLFVITRGCMTGCACWPPTIPQHHLPVWAVPYSRVKRVPNLRDCCWF